MPPSEGRALDVITIGRSSVDLYGQQIGSRWRTSPPSPSRSAAARPTSPSAPPGSASSSALSPASAPSRWARFIREQLTREGVDTRGIVTDPERLTALVLLAVEDEGVSPMIFYRADCADMALDADDIDEAFVASSRAIVVTGTHFSRPHTDAAQRKAIAIAKANGGKVGLRHRLPAQSVGPRRPCRGLRALRQVGPRLQGAAHRAARLRPGGRHRGGDHDRLRRRRRAVGPAGDPLADARHRRAEARRHGLHRL